MTHFSLDDAAVRFCPLPRLSVTDAVVAEGGPAPAGTAGFTLSLNEASDLPVSVHYETATPSSGPVATPGADYLPTSGTLTFAPGATTAAVEVPVQGDLQDEVDETFLLRLGAVTGATFADAESTAVIDDDDGPTLSIGDVTVAEPPTGFSADAVFPLTLSAPSVQWVTVWWHPHNGTAMYGLDYASVGNSLTFEPGQTRGEIRVPILGDSLAEPTEFFTVELPIVRDAFPLQGIGTASITDADGPAPALTGALTHGSSREGSLAPRGSGPARDLYVLPRPARTSFEVVVDAASGDVGAAGPRVRRLHNDLATALQESVAVGTGSARALRVENDTLEGHADYIEVTSAGCTLDCGADDTYRIRARETTARIARFNNTGQQVTVLILQNAGDQPISGHAWFYDAQGALLWSGGHPFQLPAKGSLAIPTTQAPFAALAQGSITITHDGPYGGVTGKAVALDVSAGLAFETALEPRAR